MFLLCREFDFLNLLSSWNSCSLKFIVKKEKKIYIYSEKSSQYHLDGNLFSNAINGQYFNCVKEELTFETLLLKISDIILSYLPLSCPTKLAFVSKNNT